MNRNISALIEKLLSGDRVALGQAMTLVESDREPDRAAAIQLLEWCETRLLQNDTSTRLAISGAPGVGKSSLIEALGLKAIELGYKVGVITIDPTSSFSHGSILGDKSRMTRLSTSSSAFIRSSPAGAILGGMGRRSHEMITLLAATGYDLILVETVGVGQSEHMARQLTDGFILVVQPGGGDELQGIKRGITELADMVIVNKADGPMLELAKMTKAHYQNALHYFSGIRVGWTPKIEICSSLEGTGIHDVLDMMRSYITTLREKGDLAAERRKQREDWLHWTLGIAAHQLVMNHPSISKKLQASTKNHQTTSFFKTAFDIEQQIKQLLQDKSTHSES